MAPKSKTVLVTGCSDGGTGGAIAEAFHAKGYHVFATARTPSKISEKLRSSKNVTVLSLDVVSSDSIAAAVASVDKETGGTLDVLVNNSGVGLLNEDLVSRKDWESKVLLEGNKWSDLRIPNTFLFLSFVRCVP